MKVTLIFAALASITSATRPPRGRVPRPANKVFRTNTFMYSNY